MGVGLSKQEIITLLKEKGLGDEILIEAISEVIELNNRKIEKNIPEVTSDSMVKGLRARGVRF